MVYSTELVWKIDCYLCSHFCDQLNDGKVKNCKRVYNGQYYLRSKILTRRWFFDAFAVRVSIAGRLVWDASILIFLVKCRWWKNMICYIRWWYNCLRSNGTTFCEIMRKKFLNLNIKSSISLHIVKFTSTHMIPCVLI